MSDKNNVSIEQHRCIVCGEAYATGTVLFDQKLRGKFDMYTITDYGMCPDDAAKFAEGYIALVAIDPEKSQVANRAQIKPSEVWRTGAVVHIKQAAFEQLFNVPVPEGGVTFVEPAVVDKLEALNQKLH